MRRTCIWIVGAVVVSAVLLVLFDPAPPSYAPRPPDAASDLRAWRDATYDGQAKAIALADVDAEVCSAVAGGDYRFVGMVSEQRLGVPGVWDYQERYAGTYGVRIIFRTRTDLIESESHGRFLDAASAYAHKYNLALLQKLPPP